MNKTQILEKMQRGEKLRVLFLNDVGFQYGAGIAHLRQIQSFLLMGHDVQGLCYVNGPVEGSIPLVPAGASGTWLGMRQLTHVHVDNGYDEARIAEAIREEIKAFQPDVILVGNLHGAKWPLTLFLALRQMNAFVVAYLHDFYLLSGRCAYTAGCTSYLTGCDEHCPTPNEYPILAPELIADAWHLRRRIFCGPDGIPLATNSQFTLNVTRHALKDLSYARVVYLGIDAHLFRPIDRAVARGLLGLPLDRFIILSGSVNVSDLRKGTHYIQDVLTAFADDVELLVFGHESLGLAQVHATGLLRDFRKMPLLYSAADLLIGTALEETFGQTFLEAAACGIPSVAFRTGGVPEVARHDVSARLVDGFNIDQMLTEIEFFIRNPHQREAFGRAGRAMVEAEFTLHRQGERWMTYLKGLPCFQNAPLE